MIASMQWLTFVLYVCATFYYWRGFLYKRLGDGVLSQRWLIAALAVHLVLLIYLTLELHRITIATLSETLGTFVWLTAVIFWMLEERLKDRSMGTFILPILLVLLLFANLSFDRNEPVAEVLKDVKFEVHVLAMLLAYGAFALSFIASLLHTLLGREIHKRRIGVFYGRLPSLAFFERISNGAVDIGLIFGALGYLLGFYNAQKVWGNFLLADPKFLTALLTLLIYFLHFIGRRFAGWRGQRAATVSLIGFGWLLFSFIVISIMFTRIHHFA